MTRLPGLASGDSSPFLDAGSETIEADTHRRFLRGCIFGPGCKSRRLHLLLRSRGVPFHFPTLTARSAFGLACLLIQFARRVPVGSPPRSLSRRSLVLAQAKAGLLRRIVWPCALRHAFHVVGPPLRAGVRRITRRCFAEQARPAGARAPTNPRAPEPELPSPELTTTLSANRTRILRSPRLRTARKHGPIGTHLTSAGNVRRGSSSITLVAGRQDNRFIIGYRETSAQGGSLRRDRSRHRVARGARSGVAGAGARYSRALHRSVP